MPEQRFHIAEWYGNPFHTLSNDERVARAGFKVGQAKMEKPELDRLAALEEKTLTKALSKTEAARLEVLRAKLKEQAEREMPCPFKAGSAHPICTKEGGVCSIRLYSETATSIVPIDGARGKLRALCPWRLHDGGTAFAEIGRRMLGVDDPIRVGEVGFLESTGNLDSEAGEDVGRIDMILIKPTDDGTAIADWVAVEVQAVYFSGKAMANEFRHLEETQGKLSPAQIARRPDYRSCGVKRLMPQLQTKVPTLSRWGKKMAIVVDWAFFNSMGAMESVKDLSNADIGWFIADFVEDPATRMYRLQIIEVVYTTLESATKGLTGGIPVSQSDFEQRIAAKAAL